MHSLLYLCFTRLHMKRAGTGPPSSALLPSGLESTLTTSCPSWCLYSSAAGRALPLQTPRPSPPAATGQTEPSHPTGGSASQDPAPCPHNSPPTMQRKTPRPPAPTLPTCDSRTQPLPLTTGETGRRAKPPAPHAPGPETEPAMAASRPTPARKDGACWNPLQVGPSPAHPKLARTGMRLRQAPPWAPA